mgnify:CR=1 FL=1
MFRFQVNLMTKIEWCYRMNMLYMLIDEESKGKYLFENKSK